MDIPPKDGGSHSTRRQAPASSGSAADTCVRRGPDQTTHVTGKPPPVIWHGSPAQILDWYAAVANNLPHQPTDACPQDCVHRLINSQHAVDHLLYLRWLHVNRGLIG